MIYEEIACEWTRTVDPVEEPLSIAEAKRQASITSNEEDSLIASYIAAARQAAESYLGRGLFTQTWQLQLAAFADEMYLPMAAPLQNDGAATPSTAPVVRCYDATGTLQTLATSVYLVDTISEPGCIRRAPNQAWPSVQYDRPRPVVITYVCGWTDVDNIPELIKQGLRLYVAYADADRLGNTTEADASRRAAESCWRMAGEVFWRKPVYQPWWSQAACR